MVPSSSKDVTRAMCGQRKRLRETRGDEMNVIVYVLCTFAVFLFGRGFVFCARLAVDYLAIYSVLRSLIKQIQV